MKIQNDGYIQDSAVEIVYIFHPIFWKIIIYYFYLFIVYFGLKIRLLCKNFFRENSKWRDN
jgi:hypothetical protein